MNQIAISFRTDNEAFWSYHDGTAEFNKEAVAELLEHLAQQIRDGAYPRTLADSNGNTVGGVTYWYDS